MFSDLSITYYKELMVFGNKRVMKHKGLEIPDHFVYTHLNPVNKGRLTRLSFFLASFN
jgi:hypothetical protein